jgi:hypothetical protein
MLWNFTEAFRKDALQQQHYMKSMISNIINGLFILLFTYTALSKILGYTRFRFVLSMAPLVRNYATWIAAVIPAAELIVAALIFIPATAKKGLIAGVSLLIVFTVYLVYMILTDPNLPCSCGGVIQQLSWKQHIVFNLLFIATGGVGIWLARKKE